MGSLAAELGRHRHKSSIDPINDFWQQMSEAVLSLDLSYDKVRLYQDSLPCCGFEMEIVRDLTAQGSSNFQLLQTLLDRGASLEGTESIELLMEELRWAKRMSRLPAGDLEDLNLGSAGLGSGSSGTAGLNEQQRTPAELIVARDQFIAERILQTLRPDEEGLLFIGMLHDVATWMDPSITVRYPIKIEA